MVRNSNIYYYKAGEKVLAPCGRRLFDASADIKISFALKSERAINIYCSRCRRCHNVYFI